MEYPKVLFVDDDETIIRYVNMYFRDYEYPFYTFSNAEEAVKALSKDYYDIIVTDYRMPGVSGLNLLKKAMQHKSYQYGILLTAFADKDILEDALNNKLIEKLVEKPLDLPLLKKTLDETAEKWRETLLQEEKVKKLKKENEELKSILSASRQTLIGLDGDLKQVFEKVQNVAPHQVPVLLTGETGTGKELIAGLIHELSTRKDKGFVKINCAAIPENLLESELFGHKKGSFTGALADKTGKIELAHEGTLFLDEIGDLNYNLQAKLLRVIQEKEMERVGCTKIRKVDFRLICATNKNLKKAVKRKEFRSDLYYRINTFPLHLPPLRERKRDIKPLVFYFMKKYCDETGIKEVTLTDNVISMLENYSWPGNIRELQNVVQRAVISAGTETINSDFFDFLFQKDRFSYQEIIKYIARYIISKKISLKQIEQDILKMLLKIFKGDKRKAARETMISESRFYRLKSE